MKFVNRAAILFALLFSIGGIAFAPFPGIQNDEAIFATPLISVSQAAFQVAGIPVMLMDYAGCLKAWIYAPVFALFAPSAWSIRLPVILIGALSIFLFTHLMARLGGTRAACIGGALLVTDPVFALTNHFDWGPVALQHLLFIAGLLAATKFQETRRAQWLAVAGFTFGLALWDKALFAWVLVSVCAAALIVWPRVVRQSVNWRNVGAALAGFLVGAAPLIWFNVTHWFITFRSHSVFSAEALADKLAVLHFTANGSVLFGYLVRGERRGGLLEYGFLAALLALPFIWRSPARRAALFSLLVIAGTWAQMAFTKGTGGAAHHVILLWPMPQLFLGIVLAHLRYSKISFAIAAVLAVSNLAVFETYYANLRAEGPGAVWTDAIGTLSRDPALAAADSVCVIDWGILDTLRVLHRGALPLRAEAGVLLASPPTDEQLRDLETDLRNPNAVWIAHTDTEEMFAGVGAKLNRIAERNHLRKQPVRTIFDRHGRPMFEIFQFTPPAS